jgi:PadR family transcriptional regulator AphA
MSLKHAILVLLEAESSTGYDLMRKFKEGVGYFWNAKHQQVYQQLKKLNDEGLINYSVREQSGKPDKKIYSISEQGQQELSTWINSPVKPSKTNDALLVKLYAGHLGSKDGILDELTRHQESHTKTLDYLLKLEQTYQGLPPSQQQKYLYPYLTLRRGILGEQAWLNWAQEAQKEIKK